MKPYEGKDVGGYLAALEDDKRQIVLELRGSVHEAIPDVKEVIKWGTLILERNGIVGGVMVHKDKVNLQLWRGAELQDKDRLLEGTGKGMRHLTFLKKDDITKGPLKALLKEASRLH